MKTLDVTEAQNHLRELIREVHEGGVVVLADGDRLVKLAPYDPSRARFDLDLEEDSPELEAELLKAVQGPHTPYSNAEMDAVLARVLKEDTDPGQP